MTDSVKPKYAKPIGAVWVNGYRLAQRITHILAQEGVTISAEGLTAILRSSYSLKIKINAYPEKYIAIENKRKIFSSGTQAALQPDFFIHLFQHDTGSSPAHPWRGSNDPGGSCTV